MKAAWLERIKNEDVVGLDFHHGHIVASHFLSTQTGPKLERLAIGEYDLNASDKERAASIRALWKKEKLPTRTVSTCLHSRALVVRYFRYENLNMDELPQALALEAEEALQCSSNNISMDWQLNPTAPNIGNQTTELSGTLVAAPRKTVVRHLKLVKSAGLYSIRIKASCSALSNLYTFLNQNRPTTPTCLINLSEQTADIVMHSNGCNYPRTLFSASETWENNQDYLLENIQNALLYYHLKLKNPPIERILLTGRIPESNGLIKKLAQETALPIERLNLCDHPRLTCRSCSENKKPDGICNVATGIGLGLKRSNYELV